MAVADDCPQECLVPIANTSLSGARVARESAALFDTRGKPQTTVSDRPRSKNDPGNGCSEARDRVHSNAILEFVKDHKFGCHYIAPTKPPRNAFIENFNARLRPSHAFEYTLPGNE